MRYRYKLQTMLRSSLIVILTVIVSSFTVERYKSAFAPPQLAGGKLSVIVHSANAADQISLTNLKASFKGQNVRWNDRKKIRLALMKTSTATGKLTAENVMGMTGSEMDKFYLALVFQGKITAPKFFHSESELSEYVKITDGAIGIISNTSTSNAKVLNVNE